MGPFPDSEHLAVYRDIAGLLFRYGRRDELVTRFGLQDLIDEEERPTADGTPDELVEDLEATGPGRSAVSLRAAAD